MSSEGIFKTHAEYAVKVKFCGSEEEISLEELYQAFKQRLEAEQSNTLTEVVTKPAPISRHKQQAVALGIPAELWDEYIKTRKRVKATNTPLALTTLINKLSRFAEEGYSPGRNGQRIRMENYLYTKATRGELWETYHRSYCKTQRNRYRVAY